MPWSTSTRAARLPSDWPRRVAIVARRAGGQCETTIDGRRCPLRGAECDHVRRGDDHRLANLAWLCVGHHRDKTLAEATAARALMYARGRHPVEDHPGAS